MLAALVLLLTAFAIAVASMWPIWTRPDMTVMLDWDYFNGLVRITQAAWNNYHVLPLHDPYRCGGLDMLANPQARFLHPLSWGDFFLPAHIANTWWIIVHVTLGAVTSYKLAQALKFSRGLSLLFAWLFTHSSWFALHLGEGHMTFAMISQLPLVPLCLVRIEERLYRALLLLAPAFWMMGGGQYTVIFGAYLAIACLSFGAFETSWKRTLQAYHRDLRYSLACSAPLLLTFVARIIPIFSLSIFESRPDDYLDTWKIFSLVLFHPLQSKSNPHPGYGYHEHGCYLGVLTLILMIFSAVNVAELKRHRGLWLCLFMFAWVGFGLFNPYNPWALHLMTPVLKSAHVQSRLLVIFHLCALLLALHSLQRSSRAVQIMLGLVLALEAAFVHAYAADQFFRLSGGNAFWREVKATQWKGTKKFAYYAADYNDEFGGAFCYEPAWFRTEKTGTDITWIDGPGYRGEAVLQPIVEGQIPDVNSPTLEGSRATITEYTPAHLIVDYVAPEGADLVLTLNTNTLAGFTVTEGEPTAHIISHKTERLRLAGLTGGVRRLVLEYRPWFVAPALIASVLVWVLSAVLIWRASARPQDQTS